MPTNQPHVTRQFDQEAFFETFEAVPAKGDNNNDDPLPCPWYQIARSVRQFDW